LDKDLRVTYASAGASSFLGATGTVVRGSSAIDLAPTNALPREVYLRALEGCRYHDEAVEIRTPSGAVYLEMEVRPLVEADGVIGLAVLYASVSDRRVAWSLKGATKDRLEMLTENARDIIAVLSADGRLVYVSGGLRNALGYTFEERHLHSVFEIAHPDDVAAMKARFAELASGKIDRYSMEYRSRHKDGSYRWFETVYVSALDDPIINGIVVNARDITDRKAAESRLAQREEIFRLAVNSVDGIIFEWDIIKGVTHRSSGLHEVLGLEQHDLPSAQSWRERTHPADLPDALRKINLALIDGPGWTVTYRIRDARGRYRTMLERALIQRNASGDPVKAIGSSVDVSEVRRLTDLLADTQRTAQTGGWEYSYSTRELTWTDEMYRIYDTSPQSFAVTWESMLGQCTPESCQRFHEACVRAEMTDGHFDLELEVTTLRNRRIWVRMIGHLEMAEGRPFRAYGSMQNVQAQKLAQIALEHSMDWLKLSMNMAHMHAWRWHKASDELEFAIAEGKHINLPAEYPTLEVLLGRLHPQDRPGMTRAIDQAFKYRCEVHEEFRLKGSDGRYRFFATVARPLFDGTGLPLGLVGVTQDVTSRRDSEAQLRRSEQLLRVTTTNTADVLMLVDPELRVRFINRSLGAHTVEQIVGAGVAELLPPKVRRGVIARLRQVLSTGETANHEFECEPHWWDAADLEPQFLEYRAVLVRDEGVSTGISISVRNITERKRLEQEILDIATRERNTIGRDLHDGLGQELTGVALMLRGVATRIQREAPGAVTQVNEIVAHVNQSIESARALARGLLPVSTQGGGLPFALRALARRSRDLYGLEVNFRAEMQPDIVLSETSASHLYRIAQEALTNAARHGHASRVEIFLTVTHNNFSLRIKDDGTGIGVPDKPGTGMGLKIMRYRAGMIGAKFDIGPNMPRGTVVRVSAEPSEMARLGAQRVTGGK
jgi:PAS domain S-box-containing protein